MGCACKTANARRLVPWLLILAREFNFPLWLSAWWCVSSSSNALTAPLYCYCGCFPSFTVSTAAICCFLGLAESFLLTVHVRRGPTVEWVSSNFYAVLPHRHICKHRRPMLNWAECSVNGRAAAVSYCRCWKHAAPLWNFQDFHRSPWGQRDTYKTEM